MKLRLENLWGKSRARESIEQEASEELARVSGGGGRAADMGEPAAAAELETAPAEPDVAMDDPGDDAGPDGIGDGTGDWEERMAEVRQGRR